MLAFENALSAVKMIKDQIHCQPESSLSFRREEYSQGHFSLMHQALAAIDNNLFSLS